MSTFFENDKNRQEPLMDFADAMFADKEPATITQAGMDDYNSQLRLKFDGSKLSLLKGDDELLNWKAVSGRPGYQSPEYQSVKGVGPLPEGMYNANQDQHQKIGFWDTFWGLPGLIGLNVGKWPKAQFAWGTDRVWLQPEIGTDTYGRGGFSIHGGVTPGSAGCIDLTSDNYDFMKRFLTIGQDLPLEVDYTTKKQHLE